MNLHDYQSQLLGYVFGDHDRPPLPNAGVYRSGVEAKAVRALGYQYPTIKALLGGTVFRNLATQYFREQRKHTGDWADFGDPLPAWISAQPIALQLPYIADSAQLDQAIATVERACYDDLDEPSFSIIADDLSCCTLRLNRGVVFFRSDFPVVSLWEAHKSLIPQQTLSFNQARRMLARGRGQNVLVHRSGWRGAAQSLSDTDMNRLTAFQNKRSIADALGDGSVTQRNLSVWLQEMIARRVIVGALPIE